MSSLTRLLYPPFMGGRFAAALLLLRIVAGSALFFHGLQKMARGPFGWMGPDSWAPPILQFLAAFSECFGGLALVLGLLTPLAALGIGATMAVATFVHVTRGDPFVRLPGGAEATPLLDLPGTLVIAGGRGGSYELAAMFLVAAIVLILAGPGTFSLDAKLFGRARAEDARAHGRSRVEQRA
ncbi:MAG TPA: DoxX family protein [Alphaproteobacteria bacterium]